MKWIVGIIALIVIVGGGYLLWWMKTGVSPDENTGAANTAVSAIRNPDYATASSGTCAFQDGDTVVFEINSDVASPRCAFVLQDQKLGFANKTDTEIVFDFSRASFSIAPDEVERVEEAVGTYLAPGVHNVALPIYNGSGPEAWVLGPTVGRIEGDVTAVSTSSIRSIDVELTSGIKLTLNLDAETKISRGTTTPILLANYKTALKVGTKILAIVNLENETTAQALTVRIVP